MAEKEIQYATVDINTIEPHPQNVRQGDIGAISESLKAHGQYRPIVVDRRTNLILAGNHTWKAAKALGWSQISAGFIETKDDDDALRILLADNKASDLASYDDAGLADLLKDLVGTELDLVGSLFDGDDLDDLLFKLEGSVGFVADRPSAEELIAEFELTDSRNLVLPFAKKDIEQIKQKLQTLMTELNKQSYSEVLIYLLDYYDQSN